MTLAIIADDLTGAAELASAAAEYGLSAEVQTRFAPSAAEVIAVDTNTRSLPPAEAARRVTRVTHKVAEQKPGWIYKKTDSVLRGNLRAEIEAILNVTGLERATLIPANPSKGRIIDQGAYYLEGVPLEKTPFANDPDHPRRTSIVRELLGPSDRISTPDARNSADLRGHAGELGAETLPAGGVEFFQAILERRLGRKPIPAAPLGKGRLNLYVCGSAFAWNQGRKTQCILPGIPVFPMPQNQSAWAPAIVQSLSSCPSAMAAIGMGEFSPLAPETLALRLASAVAEVIRMAPIDRIYIEGGATAAALLSQMNWTRLSAVATPAWRGVAALRPLNSSTILIAKPGSYPWPEEILPAP